MQQIKHQEIMENELGRYLKAIAYGADLPTDIAPWHCFVVDDGHCIMALLAADAEPWPGDPNACIIPIPVKSVLRGYRMDHGYVVALAPELTYSHVYGLKCPEEDVEF